jgi:hypothetical protein
MGTHIRKIAEDGTRGGSVVAAVAWALFASAKHVEQCVIHEEW